MGRTFASWLLAAAAFATCTAGRAHEFWMQPQRFQMDPGVAVPLSLLVGHGAERQRSLLPARRILRFSAVPDGGEAIDLRPALGSRVLALPQPGSYVLALETDTRAQSHLSAARFNAHLRAEGLAPALAERERRKAMTAEGAERYGRCAKVLVQAGQGGGAAAFTQPVGLALEIVPEVNPYVSPQAVLPVRVLYRGKPLAGATIRLTNLDDDAKAAEVRLSDASGRAAFTPPGRGRWMLHVAWTRVLPPGAETDFETLFSSLSFGFE
ncbi:DUF4198 domain-containing protein [Massilia endophytica]|uniref:DUF4198 domain-containing protein n=1 Tax=Massilia endophytica TaxID=2899220 RepID=UPI001E623B98|nr:DUF4198 domain-containing protein [Massilia endophytica]UGQ46882.1 DUF4198 domain-containing protein [Massilia endophytica]